MNNVYTIAAHQAASAGWWVRSLISRRPWRKGFLSMRKSANQAIALTPEQKLVIEVLADSTGEKPAQFARRALLLGLEQMQQSEDYALTTRSSTGVIFRAAFNYIKQNNPLKRLYKIRLEQLSLREQAKRKQESKASE